MWLLQIHSLGCTMSVQIMLHNTPWNSIHHAFTIGVLHWHSSKIRVSFWRIRVQTSLSSLTLIWCFKSINLICSMFVNNTVDELTDVWLIGFIYLISVVYYWHKHNYWENTTPCLLWFCQVSWQYWFNFGNLLRQIGMLIILGHAQSC